jgi:ABC-type multidrug transport system ATPase subunit
VIALENLNFEYNKNEPILKNLNLTINGKFFGLIGENGAGKTTLLKLLLGLVFPNSGEIQINNYDIKTARSEILKEIGVMHENPRFPSWARVSEFIQWIGEVRGLTSSESKDMTKFLIEKINLSGKENDRVANLSAGLTQRFALCVAIIGIPNIIILDEPTANLDVKSRFEVLDFLKHISEEYNSQIIVMSHILSDLERYCDSFAILDQGEIKITDTIRNLLLNEHHRYYIVRGEDMLLLREKLKGANVPIEKESMNELIIHHSNPEELKKMLPEGTSIHPLRSLLEQKYLDVVERKAAVIKEDM